jgi:hypothetical protein
VVAFALLLVPASALGAPTGSTQLVSRPDGLASVPPALGGDSFRVRFQGRLTPARKLRPGSYTLQIKATDDGGRSTTSKTIGFTIARKGS